MFHEVFLRECSCRVLSRGTDVRPIFNRRAISDLLIAAKNRSRTEPALAVAVGGRPSRFPFSRACAKPARTNSEFCYPQSRTGIPDCGSLCG